MDAHTLSIKDTRVTVDGHAVDSTAKTTRSTCVLPIPDPVYSALLHARAARPLDRVTNRDNYSDSGYLVVDDRDAPFGPIQSRRTGSADVLVLGCLCSVCTMVDTCARL